MEPLEREVESLTSKYGGQLTLSWSPPDGSLEEIARAAVKLAIDAGVPIEFIFGGCAFTIDMEYMIDEDHEVAEIVKTYKWARGEDDSTGPK